MPRQILEKLAATTPDCEIWRDSSPLVHDAWRRGAPAHAPGEKRGAWAERPDRPFDPSAVEKRASPDLMSTLRRTPYFRQARDGAGMRASAFAAATRRTIDFVARVRAEARQRAA